MTAEQAAATQTPAVSRRDPWFDNAKMALVTLVVVGHMWTLLPDTALNGTLYDFLYLWHVPAFVMVTGYLSRSFTWSARNMRRLVTTVALPYVVFEAALAMFRVHVGGEELAVVLTDPHWPMWYLAVLFFWRLATPLLRRIPWPLAVAVALCLLGGLSTGDTLDWARAVGMLPFFVVGLIARPAHLEILRRPATRLVSVLAMAVALGAAILLQGHLNTEWLYWRSSYGELDASWETGFAVRTVLVAAGTGLSFAFFSLTPRRGGWFSLLGPATLVVYLFHGFVLKGLEYAGLIGWAAEHPLLSLLVATPGAVAIALTLAWPPVARRLNTVVDPVGTLSRRNRRRVLHGT